MSLLGTHQAGPGSPQPPRLRSLLGKGCRECGGQRGGEDVSALPGPKAQPCISGSVQSFPVSTQPPKPQIPIIGQAGLRRRQGRRNPSVPTIHLLGAKSWYCHFPHQTPSCPLTCHLTAYCLSPPFEPKHAEHFLSTYCAPDSAKHITGVSSYALTAAL